MFKKYILTGFCCCLGLLTVAQIPPGYYSSTSGLSCGSLKTALSSIITSGQVTLIYGQLDNTQMPTVDTIRTDDGADYMIWDIYSNNNSGPEPYSFNSNQIYPTGFCGNTTPPTFGLCWNKEHTFPKSWFASAYPAYADLFIVRPTDYRLNEKRASNPYAVVGSASFQFPTAGTYSTYPMPPNPVLDKLGNSVTTGVSTTAWEPSNAVKGDLARAYFYILTRYENDLSGWATANNGTGIEKVVDAANPVYPSFNLPYLAMLYNWHIADPIDAKEIKRNDLVYTQQGNRNPYIDHPEYVALVWQCTGVIPVTITNFIAQKNTASVLLKWYATYETAFKEFEIERSTDGINFNKIGQVEGRNLANYSFTDNDLPTRQLVYYRLKMIDIDAKFTYSKIIAIKLDNHFSNALVYPNPTANKLNIKLIQALASNSTLQVTDITGRKLMEKQLNVGQLSINLNVEALPDGRYFLKIFNSMQLINESFIILK